MSSSRTLPNLRSAGFFAWRTPLLPFDDLEAFSADLQAAAHVDSPATFAAALAADRELLRQRLRALVDRPEIREALFVSSPSLDDSLAAWRQDPTSERGQKVERTLVRYLTRMAFRATPFGLFAGCALGTTAAATSLPVAARSDGRRHTRLDGDYLALLIEALDRDPELRRALVYRPNDSLRFGAGKWRYAEAVRADDKRHYCLVTVEQNDFLATALTRARDGATLAELAAALVAADADGEVTRADAEAYVGQLIDSQLLISSLQLRVTGDEPLAALVAELTRASALGAAVAPTLTCLVATERALAAIDAAPLGLAPARYRRLAAELDPLPVKAQLSRLFQVDLFKPTSQATLGPEPLAEIVRAVTALGQLSVASPMPSLQRFREAFVTRYEGRSVPLAEVLDEELGLGFERSSSPAAAAAPLLRDLRFPGGGHDEDVTAGPHFAALMGKLETALREDATEIVFDDAELARLSRGRDPRPLPRTFSVMASLSARSAAAVDAGEFRVFVHAINGPSGANLLGRFCHGDPALTEHVRDLVRREEADDPEAIFAEVVHLPEGRIGNVILRPLLRDYEISYLGGSGAPRQRQLAIADLDVSVDEGRIVLRSRSLGRRVIPRLSTAHSFSGKRNLGVYRFLGMLQLQEGPPPTFNWGALEAATFLPRVRVGRAILSLARWRLTSADLEPLCAAEEAQQLLAAATLRRRFRLPRWVAVTDHDNVLPIDLENALSVATFVHLVKPRRQITLNELFGSDERPALGGDGAYMHELVLPLCDERPTVAAPAIAPRPPATTTPARRSFVPTDDCLYVKLYTGTATANHVLRDVVAPLVDEATAQSAFDRWFFIRYADPDWHLRLRFFGDARRLREQLQPLVIAATRSALERGLVWRVQYDTYERELERYGGARGIELSEALFAADSEAALAIVRDARGDGGYDAAWRLALRGMDRLLDDLGFTLAEKLALLERCQRSYGREFKVERGGLGPQIGARFRGERLALEKLLQRDPGDDALAAGVAALDARSARLLPIGAALRQAAAAGELTTTLDSLATSYLHMHCNRMIHAVARAHEVVLYDFLERLYRGQSARRRHA